MTRLCEFPGSLGTTSPSRFGIEAERAQWAKQRGEASETARSGADAATMRASRTGSPGYPQEKQEPNSRRRQRLWLR